MPKSSIDELISAIKAVQVLGEIVARHDLAIEKIVDKLDAIERRLDELSDGMCPGSPKS